MNRFKRLDTKWVGVYGIDMANRRSVLIGLGGLVAGGGALLGTGAFTTVTAERTVNVETTGDASAFLALEPATEDDSDNGQYADGSGDTIEITLNGDADAEDDAAGLNQNARTTIRNIVQVSNNGTQDVTSLSLSITDSDDEAFSDTFSFTSSADSSAEYGNEENILDDDLGAGDSVKFGMIVDLLDGGTDEGGLPGSGDYSLTITADTAESN